MTRVDQLDLQRKLLELSDSLNSLESIREIIDDYIPFDIAREETIALVLSVQVQIRNVLDVLEEVSSERGVLIV